MELMGGLGVGDVDVYIMLGLLGTAVLRWIVSDLGKR
jgi:hypothetical protein